MIFAIAADILANVIFQELGNPISTNWCVFINFFDYAAWSSIYMNIAFTFGGYKMPKWLYNHRDFISWMFNISGIIYACYAFVELTYINETFYIYKNAMFQSRYELSHTLAIVSAILIYLSVRYIKKTNDVFKYI